MNSTKLCEYGCGQKATHQFKNGKWCCSKIRQQCPQLRNNHSKKMSGENNPMYNKTHSPEVKYKLRELKLGNVPWNKDKTGVFSNETLKKMSESSKGKRPEWSPWNKGKTKESDKLLKKMSESSKGKTPWNKGKTGIYSTETLNKISKAMKGKPGYWKGKTHSEETRLKLSKVNKGRYHSEKTRLKMSINSTYTNKLEHWKTKFPFFCKIEKLKEVNNKIQCQCKLCNKWFFPTYDQLYSRACHVEREDGNGGSYIYCSVECKNECPLFHKRGINPSSKTEYTHYTTGEYNTFREEVLKREEYKCEYCGEEANIVHHSRPQKLEPFFSLDPDYGISCCKKCHYEKGHKDECSTGELSNLICK